MRRKSILLLTLLLISDDVFGKNGNRTSQLTKPLRRARIKRSLNDDTGKIILLAGKENIIDDSNQYENLSGRAKSFKLKSTVEKESPFWGNRGRRESFSDETVPDVPLPIPKHKQNKHLYSMLNYGSQIKDEIPPFWSNRGRRDSKDPKNDNPPDLFWANRGRRQDDEPFWGTRGRRQEDESPFWGNRGRRDGYPFNKQGFLSPYWSSKEKFDDDEPFWGNRGRRQEQEPFWGNRGRRDPFEPYSGHKMNKAKSLYLYNNMLNHKNELKDSVTNAINDFKNDIGGFERNRRDDVQAPLLIDRGRDSRIKSFYGVTRNGMGYNPNTANNELTKTFQQNTIHDDRIYAEEPRYILVERSSRSSAEEDPFYITRGKKYSNLDIADAVRGRRGAIEEIVKSVRNDPYYIARGKKDSVKIGNLNATQSQYLKTRELICATVELLMMKYSEGNKVKRQAIDSDRDRRTTLKKLALQLQMDPYYVSRGKKDGASNMNPETLEEFINKVVVLCN